MNHQTLIVFFVEQPKMNPKVSYRPYHLLAAAVSLSLVACQSTPPMNADIDQARSAYNQARNSSLVADAAPIELAQAGEALHRAEDNWAAERDLASTRHLAYLASQRVNIAQYVAAQRQADTKVQQASLDRERMRADARTQESQAALQRADVAQDNARTAQAQASYAMDEATRQRDKAAQLQLALQELSAQQTQRGTVVTLQDVLFDSGRATLTASAQRTVDRIAAILREFPERRLLIEGYTDNVGGAEMNTELSQQRATAFRDSLVAAGVSRDRLEVRGYGEAYPIADNTNAAGRTQNRRVEMVFSDPFGHFASR